MSSPSRIVLVLALVCWICGSARGQASTTSPEPPILTISGEVSRPSKLTASDFAKLPRQTITAKDHNGQPATFEGVALSEILQLAGVEFGEKLRGKNLALFAVVDAADGYRVVFALPELDPAFANQPVLLADRREGKALASNEGPLRIVVPGVKRQGRWVRQVVAITIKRA